MTQVKGIIFDMDGLLFDTEMVYYRASQKIADDMGFPYDKELYLRFLGISDEELWENYHQLFAAFGKDTVNRFIQRAFDEGLRMFAAGEGELKPGVHQVLNYLEERQIPRVIASSNQRKVIDLLLEKHQLADAFDVVISFDDVTRAKPDPEIFLKALAHLGTSKEDTVIFEDSQNGVLAAAAAGIPVVMIPDLLAPTPELQEKSIAVLDSLHAVPQFLSEYK